MMIPRAGRGGGTSRLVDIKVIKTRPFRTLGHRWNSILKLPLVSDGGKYLVEVSLDTVYAKVGYHGFRGSVAAGPLFHTAQW